MWKKGMNQSSELDGFHEDEQSGKVFSEAGAGVTDMDVQGYIHVVDASKAVGDMEPMSTGFDKLSYAKMVAKNPAVTDNSSLSTGLPMDDVIETVSAEVVPFMAGSEVQVSCKDVRGLDEHTTIVINDVLFLEIRSTEGKIIKPWGKIGCSLNDGTRKCISIKKSIEFKPSTQPVLRDWLEDQMVVVSDRVDVVLVQDGVPRDLVHLKSQNDVILMKIAFHLITRRNSLWVKFMCCKYKCFDPSIGHDRDIDFWFDPWISDVGPLVDYVMVPEEIIVPGTCVADMASSNREWHWELFQHLLNPYVLLRLAAIKGPNTQVNRDIVGWNHSSNHQFTIKSAYGICANLPLGPHEDVWQIILRFRGSLLARCSYLKETIVKALGSALGSLLHNNNNLQQVSSWLKSMWGWYKVNTDGDEQGIETHIVYVFGRD
ncbi:hypothetical protein V6N13_110808 [Hibiscus sabdariffa]